MTCGQVWWPILGICALHLTHPKCTHTAVNTHTPWKHTRSSGQPFMLRRPGSSWGFDALLKGTSVVVLKVEESAAHSLPPPTIPAGPETGTRNLWGYESDSLTIRPRLPIKCKHLMFASNNQLHMCGLSDIVNLLGSSPGRTLHLKCGAFDYESCETWTTTLDKRAQRLVEAR